MGNSKSTNDRGRIEYLERQLSSGRDVLNSTKAESGRLSSALASTKAESERLSSTLASTKAELAATKTELASTKAELASTKADFKASLRTSNDLKDSLRTSNQKVEELTKGNLDGKIIIDKLLIVGELQKQLSVTNVEELISKFNLEALRKEEEKLSEQLSIRRKFEEDVEMKLRKVLEIEKQVLCVHDEVLSTMASLEAVKKEENMLKEQLLALENFEKDVEMKLEVVMKLEKQISDTRVEKLSTRRNFEASKTEEVLLKEQLRSCEEFHQEMEMKLRKVMELEKQLLFIRSEGLFVKASLEDSGKQEERLKKLLSESENYQQDMEVKLQKVFELEQEISSSEGETLSAMANLEASNKEVEELKEKLASLEKVQQAVVELKLL